MGAPSPTHSPQAERTRGVRRVLLIVLGLNLLVTAVKLVVGFRTGALAVVADGFHSILDSSANLIALTGIWAAGRPADANHPYGHRRYETLATLAIGMLLLSAGVEIGRAILERLSGGAPPEVTPISIALIALTLPVNAAVTWYETRAGRRYSSEVLLADSSHTRADVLITLSVLASLLGALYNLDWLDVVVAASVVAFIVRAAVGIFWASSRILSDTAIANPARVQEIVQSIPGVWHVHRIRSRGPADAVQLDLHVKVNPGMGTAQAHGIASEVERRLAQELPNVVDTVVHVEPARLREPTEWEALSAGLRALADGQGLGLHDLHVHVEPDGGYTAEFHLEFEAERTLGEAHAQADALEAEIKTRWPHITTVVSHLEPLRAGLPEETGRGAPHAQMKRRVFEVAESIAGPGSCHDVVIHQVGNHAWAALHLSLPQDLPLAVAHAKAEDIERKILLQEPGLERVVVHVEPPGR